MPKPSGRANNALRPVRATILVIVILLIAAVLLQRTGILRVLSGGAKPVKSTAIKPVTPPAHVEEPPPDAWQALQTDIKFPVSQPTYMAQGFVLADAVARQNNTGDPFPADELVLALYKNAGTGQRLLFAQSVGEPAEQPAAGPGETTKTVMIDGRPGWISRRHKTGAQDYWTLDFYLQRNVGSYGNVSFTIFSNSPYESLDPPKLGQPAKTDSITETEIIKIGESMSPIVL